MTATMLLPTEVDGPWLTWEPIVPDNWGSNGNDVFWDKLIRRDGEPGAETKGPNAAVKQIQSMSSQILFYF